MIGMEAYTAKLLAAVRQKSPLVHNITNYVVMNSSANILLAIGASPVMAHCRAEVEEMTSLASALVLNIGTLQEDWIEAMICAARQANAIGIPVILDPVGAGATKLRSEAIAEIMANCAISVLRGNCSEILSLGSAEITTKGVDSSLALTDQGVAAAKQMAIEKQCVIAISGAEDCITDGSRVYRVKNGQPLMTRIRGSGCGLTAVTAAFCAVAGSDLALATAAAFGYYGLCGDLAIQASDKPASFQVAFIDQLYAAGETEIRQHLKVTEA